MENAGTSVAESDGAPFKLKALPIAQTFLLGVGLFFLASITLDIVEHFTGLPERPEMRWIHDSYMHIVQAGYALLAIYFLRRTYPGNYGLEWPEGKSYVVPAILWGLLFGVLMALIDYAPQILAQKPPADKPYPLTALNIAGWTFFKGILAGPAEEVVFRGLLVTYLTQRLPGTVSFRGYTMNGAGIVVAVFYALSYSESLLTRPVIALAQFLYAFVMGVFFAYWYEKSRSLVASAVGNSVSGMVEQGLIFLMVSAWG